MHSKCIIGFSRWFLVRTRGAMEYFCLWNIGIAYHHSSDAIYYSCSSPLCGQAGDNPPHHRNKPTLKRTHAGVQD